ncbi:MAG TPA: hypothetical protein VHK64_08535 [Nocardioidaceae bacterium]|jgi:hypothetical protein|nr:hypothetical protein [Nocardioidaceae bacterium]
MAATYRLFVDWKGNGSFVDAGDEVTARVLDQRSPLSVQYGRDQVRQLSPTAPGQLNFLLNNISRDYSPENTSSPLAGYVTSGRHVQLVAYNGASNTVLFDGYIDDFTIQPGINDRSVPVSCLDTLGRFKGVQITTPLYQGLRTGDAVNLVLDAVGWPAAARDIDAGATYMPFWWLDNTDAFDALTNLCDSEGPPALVTIDAAGNVVFRDRHHRLTRAASLTSQATWRSSGTEPCISDPLTYNHGWKEIINTVSMDVPIRQIDTDPTVVWSAGGVVSVDPGGTVSVSAGASSPFINAVTPVAGTDFNLVSGAVTVGLSQTSGQSTMITLTSVGGAVVQNLQLRAQAIQAPTVTVTVTDAQSVAKYGPKSLDQSRLPMWANQYDALAVLSLIIGKRAERLPTLQVTMRGAGNAARLTECLTRDLSDRIHLTESLTGLDSDCFIEQIAHAVGQGGTEHVTTFGVEKAQPIPTNVFTFDTSGQGFDQGVFGGGSLDNPATMFRFDTAGQGFDQGMFAY